MILGYEKNSLESIIFVSEYKEDYDKKNDWTNTTLQHKLCELLFI